MSEDSHTFRSSTGWFGRIGESIKGILFELVMNVAVVSFGFLIRKLMAQKKSQAASAI